MVSTQSRRHIRTVYGAKRRELTPLPPLERSSDFVKHYEDAVGKLSPGDRKTLVRMRSRLLRHVCELSSEGDLRAKVEILRTLGEDEPIAAWHRRKIIGYQADTSHSLVAESRLKFLIRELTIELSEKLGVQS